VLAPGNLATVPGTSRRGADVRTAAGAGGADAGDDHQDDPAGRRHVRDLPEHEQSGQQRDGRFQAHQGAEGTGGQAPQGEELQAERHDRVQCGQAQHDGEHPPPDRPDVELRAYALTRHGRLHWPPLALVTSLLVRASHR